MIYVWKITGFHKNNTMDSQIYYVLGSVLSEALKVFEDRIVVTGAERLHLIFGSRT